MHINRSINYRLIQADVWISLEPTAVASLPSEFMPWRYLKTTDDWVVTLPYWEHGFSCQPKYGEIPSPIPQDAEGTPVVSLLLDTISISSVYLAVKENLT